MKNLSLHSAALIFGILSAGSAFADEATIAVQLPLTGAVASWAGPPMERGVEVAIDHLAAEFGDKAKSIKMIMQDNASDKNQAITLMNRFITNDKASVIIGPPTSPLALAAAPVANASKTPVLALGVSQKITESGEWAFKLYQNPPEVLESLAKYAVETAKVKSIVLVYGRDNEAMVAYKNILKDYLAAHGVTNIAEESVLTSQTDFIALATKLVDMDPEMIYLGALPEASANIVLQARQAGLPETVKLVGSDSIGAPDFIRIGGKAIDGTIYPAFYYPDDSNPVTTKFRATFREKFGSEADPYAAISYTATMLAGSAVRRPDRSPRQCARRSPR
ncbi:branched-chain amino acid transport system substrate-binding protein [Rhodoligotrophos appendicifer]|uniref:ABC transporter substrate-binding protein n=1 Tax=Rhodoligotrophos appendicifer TaxID=987056 RepID=UPI001185AD1B|nr:ABC transporter substrate-binding protein [Rhodoligotrophos appendicifer]